MREILFRGKRLDNGKWIEGSLWLYGEDACIDGALDFSEDFWIKVDPATVGQYTGLTDMGGKRIFEGDIVAAYYEGELQTQGVVVYGHGSFEVREELNKLGLCLCFIYSEGMSIIKVGNIHDTPELLEV